jgi:hypothetical protein
VTPYDPFDAENLRVEAMADVDVEKVLTSIPVRRPKRTEFVRVHPEYVLDTYIVERDTGMDRESYLVATEVMHRRYPPGRGGSEPGRHRQRNTTRHGCIGCIIVASGPG